MKDAAPRVSQSCADAARGTAIGTAMKRWPRRRFDEARFPRIVAESRPNVADRALQDGVADEAVAPGLVEHRVLRQ
jgi:hypothetical protein